MVLTGDAYHYCSGNGTGGEYWGPIALSCTGEVPGGGLTSEQLAALQQILQALQDAQTAYAIAGNNQGAVNSLYSSLISLQNSLNDTRALSGQALATINNALISLVGFLLQADALDQQAKEMIAQQAAEIIFQQNIVQANNNKVQGTQLGDPVYIASGVEDFKSVDFKYKTIADVIKIQRRYRSNRGDIESSFGAGWFFNYDTHIVVGRKPFIKERELLTHDLDSQAQALVAQATETFN